MPRSKDFSNIELLLFHPSPESQERLYLILIISVTCGVVLCLLIVVTRLIFTRKRKNDDGSEHGKSGGQFKTSNTGETTITNGFSDDISEIDADIDLTTPIPMSTSSHVTRNDVSPLLRLNFDIIMLTFRLIFLQNYNSYTPSPSPYGNLGPSNISHTSSTLLMPQSSISSNGTGPPSLVGGPMTSTLILPSSIASTGFGEL